MNTIKSLLFVGYTASPACVHNYGAAEGWSLESGCRFGKPQLCGITVRAYSSVARYKVPSLHSLDFLLGNTTSVEDTASSLLFPNNNGAATHVRHPRRKNVNCLTSCPPWRCDGDRNGSVRVNSRVAWSYALRGSQHADAGGPMGDSIRIKPTHRCLIVGLRPGDICKPPGVGKVSTVGLGGEKFSGVFPLLVLLGVTPSATMQ